MNEDTKQKINTALDTWLNTQDSKARAQILIAIAQIHMKAQTSVNNEYTQTLLEIKKELENLDSEESESERTKKIDEIRKKLGMI